MNSKNYYQATLKKNSNQEQIFPLIDSFFRNRTDLKKMSACFVCLFRIAKESGFLYDDINDAITQFLEKESSVEAKASLFDEICKKASFIGSDSISSEIVNDLIDGCSFKLVESLNNMFIYESKLFYIVNHFGIRQIYRK